MIIKNVTDKTTPKVAGFGRIWIEPGKQKEIPDQMAYVNEVDEFGKETGKRIVLPALTRMKELGMIDIIETARKKAEPSDDDAGKKKAEPTDGDTEKKDGDTSADRAAKKAEAAAKRAATRAANKAAAAAE